MADTKMLPHIKKEDHKLKDKYIFKSERLGFRNWTKDDLTEFAELNADSDVMEHFPKPLTNQETAKLVEKLQSHYEKNGYTYFATDIVETGEFIGFVGLAYQEYKTEFSPATDIGWRLKKSAWGKGYATEGAKRCIEFAFSEIGIDKVFAICTVNNWKSENVMKKIGMIRKGEFNHPELREFPDFEKCVWYEIENK